MQALEEKSIKYKGVYTDLFNGQSLSPKFLKINPAGTVPVLIDGDKTITDSRQAQLAEVAAHDVWPDLAHT
jgi:glutathione S-transferase